MLHLARVGRSGGGDNAWMGDDLRTVARAVGKLAVAGVMCRGTTGAGSHDRWRDRVSMMADKASVRPGWQLGAVVTLGRGRVEHRILVEGDHVSLC